MKMTILTNCDIFSGDEVLTRQSLALRGGLVHLCGEEIVRPSEIVIDLKGASVSPGLVDLQVNGGDGILFNDDPSLNAITSVVNTHRKYGTTSICPTVFSAPIATMKQLLWSCLEFKKNDKAEAVCGIHFEGPLINPEKAGAHEPQTFDLDEIISFYLQSAKLIPTIVTLAPEIVGNSIIENLSKSGVIVFLGHSEASYATALEAFSAGAVGTTHLFNAMTPLSAREPGLVGATLDSKSQFSLIGDGCHVHWSNVKRSLRGTNRGKAFWVSDANSLAGSEADTGVIAGKTVTKKNGVCVNSDGILAGSCHPLSTMVKRSVQQGGIPRTEALRMASLYPANVICRAQKLGRVSEGCIANLLITNNEIEVIQVYFDGKLCVFE
ncbi:MAG: N-acetylglucosamine-6-phosphate deacetylase [Rhodobacteraceae bacterium]|nr:N-acetylglucosamine-6-phosphate deacetylase [Paracoccaceae bacterium]